VPGRSWLGHLMGSPDAARSVDGDWLHDAVAVASRREWRDDGSVAGCTLSLRPRRSASRIDGRTCSLPRCAGLPGSCTRTRRPRSWRRWIGAWHEVDESGYATLRCARPKAPSGRYALLSKNGRGVSVNLEYLIQIGVTAELGTVPGRSARRSRPAARPEPPNPSSSGQPRQERR
jgi:hypothetical protein